MGQLSSANHRREKAIRDAEAQNKNHMNSRQERAGLTIEQCGVRPDENCKRAETVVRDTAQFAESLVSAVSPFTGPRAEVMRAIRPKILPVRTDLRGTTSLCPAVCVWPSKLSVTLCKLLAAEVPKSRLPIQVSKTPCSWGEVCPLL